MAEWDQTLAPDLSDLVSDLGDSVPMPVDIPLIPAEFTIPVLSAIAAGGDPQALTAELKAQITLIVMQNGWAPEDGARAADAFIEAMLNSLGTDGRFQPTVDIAEQAYRDALMGYGRPPPQETSPTDELVARMADGEEPEPAITDLIRNAVSQVETELLSEEQMDQASGVFIENFQVALAEGQSPEEAMALAMDAFETSVIEQSVGEVEIPPSAQLIAAMASGGEEASDTIDAAAEAAGIDGDINAFVEGVRDALASGENAEAAIASAREQQQVAAQTELTGAVELSPADRLLNALAAGGQQANAALADMEGDDTGQFAQALEQSLAGGESINQAMNQAEAAEQASASAAEAQLVPMDPAARLAAALAGGEPLAAGLGEQLSGAGADALAASLASGEPVGQALEQAQAANQAVQAQQQAQSVPVSPADQL
ncbi:MAG: hypothetical protein ACPG4N_01055, partial [Gammaproteobacteria bacterium]